MTIKVNREGQNLIHATPKQLNQSSSKFARVITSGIPITVQKVVQIGSGVSFLRTHNFAPWGPKITAIFWVLQVTHTAKTPARILT